MIEVEGLTKQYKSVRAVDDLTFQVKPGMVTGFLGPNGAGKSTTMRMILGLDTPTAGRARINGKHYHELKYPLREVGALLDAKAVHRNRSAANHLKWIAQSNGISTSRVDEVLGLVGLSDVAGKKVGGFSLGMGQRLGIASALLGDPEYLVLDEPVNGLDPTTFTSVAVMEGELLGFARSMLHGPADGPDAVDDWRGLGGRYDPLPRAPRLDTPFVWWALGPRDVGAFVRDLEAAMTADDYPAHGLASHLRRHRTDVPAGREALPHRAPHDPPLWRARPEAGLGP